MKPEEVQVGQCYNLSGYGHCVVIYKNRNGFWASVWGGPSGDKCYTVKGVRATDLSEKDCKHVR